MTTPSPELPTNRRFGRFFSAVFAVAAAYWAWKGWLSLTVLALTAAGGFGAAAHWWPHRLEPLNRGWYRLGLLLGTLMTPIVLGLIFYLLITPVALATRCLGRDELRLRKRSVPSYWVDRQPPGPSSDSFKNPY